MTPKEKAVDLIEKFISHTLVFDEGAGWLEDTNEAKECALIAVDEILYEFDHLAWDNDTYGNTKMKYWQEVKKEIKKYGGQDE